MRSQHTQHHGLFSQHPVRSCQDPEPGVIRTIFLILNTSLQISHPVRSSQDPEPGDIVCVRSMSALQTLEQCRERLEGLLGTVERCRTPINSRPGTPDIRPPPPSPLCVAVSDTDMPATERAHPRCHDCHGPLGPTYHGHHPHGMGICPLEHYELCGGGIEDGKDKSGHIWKGCPPDHTPPEEDPDIVVNTLPVSDEQSDSSFTSSQGLDDPSYRPSRNVSPTIQSKPRTKS